jgi:hypothetical protein
VSHDCLSKAASKASLEGEEMVINRYSAKIQALESPSCELGWSVSIWKWQHARGGNQKDTEYP